MRIRDEDLLQCLPPAPVAWDRTTQRLAAVLAPVFERNGEDWLLFVVRRDDLRSHAGQVAFPGGGAEPGEGPRETMLREVEEELGMPAAGVRVLAGLPSRTSSSGFRVHCFVGRIPDPAQLRPDSREIARLLALPWSLLAEASRWEHRSPAPGSDGRQHPESPHFPHAGELVWGLTGRICWDLRCLLAREAPPVHPYPAPDGST